MRTLFRGELFIVHIFSGFAWWIFPQFTHEHVSLQPLCMRRHGHFDFRFPSLQATYWGSDFALEVPHLQAISTFSSTIHQTLKLVSTFFKLSHWAVKLWIHWEFAIVVFHFSIFPNLQQKNCFTEFISWIFKGLQQVNKADKESSTDDWASHQPFKRV